MVGHTLLSLFVSRARGKDNLFWYHLGDRQRPNSQTPQRKLDGGFADLLHPAAHGSKYAEGVDNRRMSALSGGGLHSCGLCRNSDPLSRCRWKQKQALRYSLGSKLFHTRSGLLSGTIAPPKTSFQTQDMGSRMADRPGRLITRRATMTRRFNCCAREGWETIFATKTAYYSTYKRRRILPFCSDFNPMTKAQYHRKP